MRKLFLAAAIAVAACRSDAQPQAPVAPNAPKLLIVISVDQLSSDLFEEYRPQFTGGLARLASGTVFRNGYQSHAATETCPGHSTILTGSRPAKTGIVGNLWIDQSTVRAREAIYCAENERVPGTSATSYRVSDVHLKVPTLGELMKAKWPASRNVAVAGKDRSAVMMGGHRPDQRWYWNGSTFATDLGFSPPRSVARTNNVVAATIAAPREPLVPPPVCSAKAQRIVLEGSGRVVGNGAFGRRSGSASGFRASPEFDGTVLALSAALIAEMQLGADATPDIISIGLSATDYVGHTYGSGGQEMCLHLLSLDRDLGDFFGVLDRSGIDYAVALTADHGGEDIPERLRMRGVKGAVRVDPELETARVAERIGRPGALLGPQRDGNFIGDVYIDRGLAPADRERVLNDALKLYRGHPQVAAAYSREEILRTEVPTSSPDKWSLLEMTRASFDAQRSGDIFVMLKPHITPIIDTTTYAVTHGSPWDYDRRVPIIFWRAGMPAASPDEAIETIDIMPTLAAMLGLSGVAETVDGRCLQAVSGVACETR